MVASKRINYLDCIRGFALLLVILGHIYIYTNPIKVWIYSFHMPLFFIISGFLWSNKNIDIKITIIKRFKALIIPYILFGLVFFILRSNLNSSINLSLKNYIFSLLTTSNLGALWFLPSLFIIEVMFSVLNKLKIHDSVRIIITLILFFIGLNGNKYYTSIYIIVIYRSLVGFGFFVLGKYIFKYIKNIKVSYIVIFFMLLVNVNLSLKNSCVDLWGLAFNNKVLYVVCSILGSFTTILFFKNISSKFENISLLNYVGINSLIIMSTHQLILDTINRITGINSYGTLEGLFICTIILIIEIPIIYIINRYLPFMIGKLNKK